MARQGKEALNDELQETICRYIRAGNTYTAAAAAAGITSRTFRNWMTSGEKAKSGKYFRFFRSIKKAEGEAEVHAVAIIRQSMGKSWQAAMTWLERKNPKDWGRREFMESKNTVTELSSMTKRAQNDPEFLDLLLEIQRRIDAGSHASGGPGESGK